MHRSNGLPFTLLRMAGACHPKLIKMMLQGIMGSGFVTKGKITKTAV
jgi:hypothetical protein